MIRDYKHIVLNEDFQPIKEGVYEVINSSRNKRTVVIRFDGNTSQKTLPPFSAGDVLISSDAEIRQRPGRYEVSLTPKTRTDK